MPKAYKNNSKMRKVTEIAYHLIAFPFTVKGYFPGQFVYLAQLTIISPDSNKVGWMGNFHGMAQKTVIRNLLSKYGYLSVESLSPYRFSFHRQRLFPRSVCLPCATHHHTPHPHLPRYICQ